MNKVIIINLAGTAYQLEESGYEALRAYLDAAGRRLEGNPDRAEIIADIEQAIGEKFRGLLGPHRNVVGSDDVARVLAEMGPVEDGSSPGSTAPSGGAQAPEAGARPAGSSEPVKRLHRVHEGGKLAGVCNGIAAYFNIDVTIVRVLFIAFTFAYGVGLWIYLIMMFVVPAADTPAKKAAAYGVPSTAEEFIRRAKAGYYAGVRSFGDRHAHREWRRKFKREMRSWSRGFAEEVRSGADRWHASWHASAPSWGALALLGLAQAVLGIVMLFAIVSLIIRGTALGFAPPAGMPVWLAIVVVFILFRLLMLPFRAVRHGLWYRGYAPGAWVFDAVVWTAILIAGLWFIDRHHYDPREIATSLLDALHRALDALDRALPRRQSARGFFGHSVVIRPFGGFLLSIPRPR